MSEVIKAENISKLYRLGLISSRSIAKDINRLVSRVLNKENPDLKIGMINDRKSNGEYVWALKDISFSVNKGDVLAIIGMNGAGKSTLLKILSRVTSPTEGKIKIKGRVASLLEVGTGFHQELTGRENIFLNGSILGMTKAEIRKKFDDIVEFSGIGNYIDTPVKRYSSGMFVRLAFAVAAYLDPEILIVDEVLAVGDAEFQKKCIGKMQDVSANEGRTVLFVSHNMAAVKNLCTTGILLEHGKIKFSGSAEDTIDEYLSETGDDTKELKYRTDRGGNGKLIFTEVILRDKNENSISQILSGEQLTVEFKYESSERLRGNIILGVTFMDMFGNIKANFVSDEMGIRIENPEQEGSFFLKIPRLLLRSDNYRIRLFASLNTTMEGDVLDSVENAVQIYILPGDFWKSGKINRAGSYGLMDGIFSTAMPE